MATRYMQHPEIIRKDGCLTLEIVAGVEHIGGNRHMEGPLHLCRQLLVDVPILQSEIRCVRSVRHSPNASPLAVSLAPLLRPHLNTRASTSLPKLVGCSFQNCRLELVAISCSSLGGHLFASLCPVLDAWRSSRSSAEGPHLENELGALDSVQEATREGGGDVSGAVAQELVVHVCLKERQCILGQATSSSTCLQHPEACTGATKIYSS